MPKSSVNIRISLLEIALMDRVLKMLLVINMKTGTNEQHVEHTKLHNANEVLSGCLFRIH